MFSNDALSLLFAPNPDCLSYQLVAISPFVIISTHGLHRVAVDHLGELQINDGCAGIFDNVRGHERVTANPQDTDIAIAFRIIQSNNFKFGCVEHNLKDCPTDTAEPIDGNLCNDSSPAFSLIIELS